MNEESDQAPVVSQDPDEKMADAMGMPRPRILAIGRGTKKRIVMIGEEERPDNPGRGKPVVVKSR